MTDNLQKVGFKTKAERPKPRWKGPRLKPKLTQMKAWPSEAHQEHLSKSLLQFTASGTEFNQRSKN